MKFVKFLTRKYTPLEHDLIMKSLLKRNTSISGIYYTASLDISRRGLIDIYASKKDIERNKKWILNKIKKDSNFIDRMFKNGLKAIKKISKPQLGLLNKIAKLQNGMIIKELLKLRQKIFTFGGFFDFTIYLDNLGIELSKKNIKRLSEFHDYRKKVFIKYFEFFKNVVKKIAEKNKVESGNLDYLTLSEIIKFLQGKLKIERVNDLQRARKKRYITKRFNNREIIITRGFSKELKRIEKSILKEKIVCIDKIKGISAQRGVVKGIVKIISQIIPLNKIPSNRIIVTQMTSPRMVPILKKSLAIITDEGGLLCHAAHVAREFRIPAIIGTKIATKVLKNGDLVEVDANKGIVRIIKKAK